MSSDDFARVARVRCSEGHGELATDSVAREEPLEIQLGGAPLAVLMRTPGHDPDLALGFLVSERWMDAAGTLRGVMLKAGACEIGLSQDDWAKGRGRKKGVGMRLWCETAQDIDELARRIEAAGGQLSEPPTTQAWGARSLSVKDPDGFHLTLFREG